METLVSGNQRKETVTMMESIAAASMSMSQAQFEQAYDIAVMKKSMTSQEQQAEALINDMLAGVPMNIPSQYGFDVYG